MKQISLLLSTLILLMNCLLAQSVKIFHETVDQKTVIYGSNPEFYPSSVMIDFKKTNMTFSEGDKNIFVIPPKTEKYKIGELSIKEPGSKYKFSYTYLFTMGDVTITNYDKTLEYDLPFQKGKSYNVFQGYNGNFSHQNENALDFTMPEGTEILAAREGVVVKVVKNNTESCPKEECKKYNNYITVMHSDGSFATYAHIKYNGTTFKEGDTVKRGDVIALSGNTGWTSGPHLHFVCYFGGFDKRKTLETKFKVNDGSKAVVISEGNNYERQY